MGNAQSVRRPLKIRGAFTWHTGSHELFDYDNNNNVETIISPQGKGFLQRKGLELNYTDQQQEDWETLFKMEELRNGIVSITDGQDTKQQSQQLWMVLQPKYSFILNQGDILKLGKIIVTIKQIVLEQNPNEITVAQTKVADTNIDMIQVFSSHSGISRKTGSPQCRICFDQYDTEDDPLISPCNCSGTQSQIHLNCLKAWLQNKITKKISDISYSYNWGRLRCEVCGSRFEETYQKHGKQHWILPFIQKPQPPYIILQSYKTQTNINPEDEQSTNIVFITQLQQNLQIKIGRDNLQHIRINDISVSRNHCSFVFVHGRLMVCDKSSKFGTLIRFKNSTTVPINNLSLQYGRTNVQIHRQNDILGCCLECIEGQQFEISNNI